MPKPCPSFEELVDGVDGHGHDAAAIEGHAATCATCAATLAWLRLTIGAIASGDRLQATNRERENLEAAFRAAFAAPASTTAWSEVEDESLALTGIRATLVSDVFKRYVHAKLIVEITWSEAPGGEPGRLAGRLVPRRRPTNVAGIAVRLRPGLEATMSDRTASGGLFAFIDVPAGVPLELTIEDPDDGGFLPPFDVRVDR